MWNDTDLPLAFLITFRSYGTWLHGDDRGSVNRFRNQYNSRRLPPEKKWMQTNTQRLRREIVILTAAQRACVEEAVHETCEIRQWHLHAMNARTNHVHTVVAIGAKKPDVPLNAFKANATRKMREDGCWQSELSPWADKGSKRYLWNELTWHERLTTSFTGRAMNYLTLMIEPC
ncbi:MAG: transposase [Pyrinomonadaceae bacterium]